MSSPTHSKNIHKCAFCSQVFPTKTEIQTHFRRHASGEIDYQGKPKPKKPPKPEEPTVNDEESSSNRTKAKEKRNMITDEKKCDVCGMEFDTVSRVITHTFRKHPNYNKKFYCPFCGSMFPLKVNRDKHIESKHSENYLPLTRYPCKYCMFLEFYNRDALKYHVESVHKRSTTIVHATDTPAPSMKIVVNNGGEASSVYYCHLCGCEYMQKFNLRKHLDSKHTHQERAERPDEMVQCNMCSALFYSKMAYESHNYHHREGDMFATDEEHRKQVVQRVDQDFDLRRIPSAIERSVSKNRNCLYRHKQSSNRERTPKEQPHMLQSINSRDDKESDRIKKTHKVMDDLRFDTILLAENFDKGIVKFSELLNEPIESESESERGGKDNVDKARKRKRGKDKGEPINSQAGVSKICKDNVNKKVKSSQSESVVLGFREEDQGNKMEDSEEDINILGTVNPDTVMSNPSAGRTPRPDGLGIANKNPAEGGTNRTGGLGITNNKPVKNVTRTDTNKNNSAFKRNDDINVELKDEPINTKLFTEVKRKQNLMEDSEDDSEISCLGTVNPDSVISNPGKVEDLIKTDDEYFEAKEEPLDLEKYKEVKDEPLYTETFTEAKDGPIDTEDYTEIKEEEEEFEVEKIVGLKYVDNGREFLIRWKGFESADDTWEREEFLNCPDLIKEFIDTLSTVKNVKGNKVGLEESPKEPLSKRPKRSKTKPIKYKY